MNERRIAAILASLVLVALPVAQFARTGDVSEGMLGGLLIVAFGGGGFAADKAIKVRIRRWLAEDDQEKWEVVHEEDDRDRDA